MKDVSLGFGLGVATVAAAYLLLEPVPRVITGFCLFFAYLFLKYSIITRDEVARETKRINERIDDVQAFLEGRLGEVEKKIEAVNDDEF